MKTIFKVAVLGLWLARGVASADDGTDDLDGDGDIDADDRALLDAAETITITDRSEGTQLVESARAVTVIDLKDARERTADLGEVLSRTHGIQVRRVGGLGSDARFSLNGLYDDQVRFFLDGVPLAYSGFGQGVANVPVDLVHRVDVYRGVVPASLGADALGGAVDLATDPSWVDRASVSYQVGSFGTHRASLGTRVRDDATGLAVGLSMFTDRSANDYEVDVEVPDERGVKTPAVVRRFHDGYTAGGVIVEGGLVERGHVRRAIVRVFGTQHDKELQNNPLMSAPYGEAEYAVESRGATGDLVLEAGAWRGRLLGGAMRSRTDFRDLSEYVYDWYGNRVGTRPTPGEQGSPSDQLTTNTGLFARGVLERRLGARQRLRLAIAPNVDRRGGTDFRMPNPGGRDPLSARRHLYQLVTGVEHELGAADDRLQNIAFAKHYLLYADIERVDPGFVFRPDSHTRQHVGFGDSLRYRLGASVLAKASYEWATRLPTAEETFGDGVLVRANYDLRPERSHNVNLGVQLDHDTERAGTIAGELNGFMRLADGLIILLGNEKTSHYDNVWTARVLGVEAVGSWAAPGGWLALEANGTVQDIRNQSSEGAFEAFEGDRIPNRPWLLASLTASTRRRAIVRPHDEVRLFAASRYVDGFFRGWESQGIRDLKQTIPSQITHSAGITYALRTATPIITTLELSNFTDARVFDSYGVQRPGRAISLKVSAQL